MRRVPRFTIALIATVLASMSGMRALEAATSEESSFASKINGERSSRGIATLRWSEDLAVVARRHSSRMADQNDLHHNSNLRNEVDGWEVLGENVGYGPGVDELHQAFMNSASHRSNILDGDYTLIGVGTVWREGTLWVTEVFMRPERSSSGSSGPTSKPKSTSTKRRPSRHAAPAARSQTPPRKPAAPAAAPVPAADGSAASDLTRLMVSRLLGSDEPAVGMIGIAEMFVAPVHIDDEQQLASVSFRPFAILVGRVNREILAGG